MKLFWQNSDMPCLGRLYKVSLYEVVSVYNLFHFQAIKLIVVLTVAIETTFKLRSKLLNNLGWF